MQRFFPNSLDNSEKSNYLANFTFLMKALHESIEMGKEKIKIIVIKLKTFFGSYAKIL